MKRIMLAAALAAAAFASSAHAQTPPPDAAVIANVKANSGPTPPAGLKVTCLTDPNTTQSAQTCPVVQRLGTTTWAYSYTDNRVSLALVTYDASGKILHNVEQTGLRYVWNMTSSLTDKTVTIFGQSNASATLPWTSFGP
jgi:hypothetical protein